MSRAKNIVFDVGNVLNEWNPVALVETYFAHALPAGMSAVAFAAAMLREDCWLAYDHGSLTSAALCARLAERLDCDEASLRQFIDRIPHVLPALAPGIAALTTLMNQRDAGAPIRVFYLSNMPVEFAEVLERRFSWFGRFDGGIFSGRARLSKPDAAIYAALEREYALLPAETLFLDDALANVQAAQARGWCTIQVLVPDDVPRELARHGFEIDFD